MRVWLLALSLSLFLTGPSDALAATIDFDDLAGTNLTLFSSYEQDGFSVEATNGEWREAHVFGGPVPAIYGIGSGASVDVRSLATPTFFASAVDLADGGPFGMDYSLEGFLDGASQFTSSGTVGNAFETIGLDASQPIDLLRITLVQVTGSANLDNIVVTAIPVPEPTTATLIALGLAVLGHGCGRRPA